LGPRDRSLPVAGSPRCLCLSHAYSLILPPSRFFVLSRSASSTAHAHGFCFFFSLAACQLWYPTKRHCIAQHRTMDPAYHPSEGHESDQLDHEAHALLAENGTGETWALVDGAPVHDAAGSDSTPHVSLFSPTVPATHSPPPRDFAIGSSRAHAGNFSPTGPSRSLGSLANITAMAKRAARLKLSDEHLPIVQLQTQIDQAQKSADDPTTPLETENTRRTTFDLTQVGQSTSNDINKLFSASAMTSGSRAPSYSNATGPLYLRGTPSFVPRKSV